MKPVKKFFDCLKTHINICDPLFSYMFIKLS